MIRGIYTQNTTGNANIVKYHVTWMSIPMKLQWAKMTEYPTTQGIIWKFCNGQGINCPAVWEYDRPTEIKSLETRFRQFRG